MPCVNQRAIDVLQTAFESDKIVRFPTNLNISCADTPYMLFLLWRGRSQLQVRKCFVNDGTLTLCIVIHTYYNQWCISLSQDPWYSCTRIKCILNSMRALFIADLTV